MKFFIAIIFATVAFASADENDLFESSRANHQIAANLQKSVTDYAIQVRTAVPRVLGGRANGTIANVEFNVDKLLDQEAAFRATIYDPSVPRTSCIGNLRVLLNAITEFTGFESSNCVAKYDVSLSSLIRRTYGDVAAYEKTFGDVLRVVPKSFTARNMFLQYSEIETEFTTTLSTLQAQWNAEVKDIAAFENIFALNIDQLNAVLNTCFANIQAFVNPSYAILANEIATCTRFDNSHNPFAVFQ